MNEGNVTKMDSKGSPENKQKLSINFSVDLRIVIIVLLVIICAMFVIWKPWTPAKSDSRTVKVTGDATVKAEADEVPNEPVLPIQECE